MKRAKLAGMTERKKEAGYRIIEDKLKAAADTALGEEGFESLLGERGFESFAIDDKEWDTLTAFFKTASKGLVRDLKAFIADRRMARRLFRRDVRDECARGKAARRGETI